MGILWVHRAQGHEIMALKLQDMYMQLGFSLKAAKLLMIGKEFSLTRMLMTSVML